MAYEYRYPIRVEFAETDLAGIVHFSHYFCYMERAEHAFFRSLGLSVHLRLNGRVVGWPRVHADCSWQAPLKFEDEIEVHLLVRKKTKRSITYQFRFFTGDQQVARGSIKVACVAFDPETKKMSSIPIPAEIGDRIEEAPAEARKG